MNLKPTHHALFASQFEVTAWQFTFSAPLPKWMATIFSENGTHWVARSKSDEVVYANVTDWAVVVEKSVVVLTHPEFNLLFKPL